MLCERFNSSKAIIAGAISESLTENLTLQFQTQNKLIMLIIEFPLEDPQILPSLVGFFSFIFQFYFIFLFYFLFFQRSAYCLQTHRAACFLLARKKLNETSQRQDINAECIKRKKIMV